MLTIKFVLVGQLTIWLFGITVVACTEPSGTTGRKREKVGGLQLKVIAQSKINLI